MTDNVRIARTTLNEIRAILAEQEVPDPNMQKFAEASIDMPGESVIEIRITGQFVSFALVEEKVSRDDLRSAMAQLGYRGENSSGGVSQIQLGAFRKMFYHDCEHDSRVEAFIQQVEGISDQAIVQIITTDGKLDIGLLADDEGNLLEFS
jgi:hypothetical protein